jgi:hypothetical protein
MTTSDTCCTNDKERGLVLILRGTFIVKYIATWYKSYGSVELFNSYIGILLLAQIFEFWARQSLQHEYQLLTMLTRV